MYTCISLFNFLSILRDSLSYGAEKCLDKKELLIKDLHNDTFFIYLSVLFTSLGGGGAEVAQSVEERATPGEEVVRSILAGVARSLLFRSVSV